MSLSSNGSFLREKCQNPLSHTHKCMTGSRTVSYKVNTSCGTEIMWCYKLSEDARCLCGKFKSSTLYGVEGRFGVKNNSPKQFPGGLTDGRINVYALPPIHLHLHSLRCLTVKPLLVPVIHHARTASNRRLSWCVAGHRWSAGMCVFLWGILWESELCVWQLMWF